MIKRYIISVLSNFTCYRKKQGGTWYEAVQVNDDYGLAGSTPSWMREVPKGWELLKTEKWVKHPSTRRPA